MKGEWKKGKSTHPVGFKPTTYRLAYQWSNFCSMTNGI